MRDDGQMCSVTELHAETVEFLMDGAIEAAGSSNRAGAVKATEEPATTVLASVSDGLDRGRRDECSTLMWCPHLMVRTCLSGVRSLVCAWCIAVHYRTDTYRYAKCSPSIPCIHALPRCSTCAPARGGRVGFVPLLP